MKTLRTFALMLSLLPALSLQALPDAPKSFRLAGKVVDAEGRPVAGAIVERLEYGQGLFTAEEGVTAKQRVTTGDDGAFELSLPVVNGQVIARKPGLAPAWSHYWNPTRNLTNEILVLLPSTTLAGVVVDEADKPVADATVSVSMAYCERQREDGGTIGSYLSGKTARECFSTRTSADGKFRIEGFPKDASADLAVVKSGKFLPLPQREYVGPDTMLFRAGQQDIRLVLRPAAGIEGKVLAQDTGKPMAGARLSLQVNRPGYGGMAGLEPVTSGADGSFRFADLAPGNYVVWAGFGTNKVPDWVAETVSVAVEAGQTARDVQVSAIGGGFLEATVLGKEDLRPSAGVNLNARKGAYIAGGATGTNGSVLLRLPPGDYQVAAYQGNSRSQGTSATVESGQTNRIQMELSPPPKITGVVRDPAGAPVPGIQLQVFPEFRANVAGEVVTDANGRYELQWNPRVMGGMGQTLCLIARDAARNLAAARDIEEDSHAIDLSLEPGLTIAGRVEDAAGKPLTNATVQVYLWSGNMGSPFDNRFFHVDAQARFEIAALPPDRKYSANATAKGFGSASQQIESAEAETNRVQLEPFVLRVADQKLAGQVLDDNDKPVARASVSMYGVGQPNNHVRTDDQGRFKFDQVCEGQIQVSASAQRSYGNARVEAGDTNVLIRLRGNQSYSSREPAPQRAGLKGKPLPDLAPANFAGDAAPSGKPVLLCLFDHEQRPSRRLVRLLSERYDALKQKGVTVLALQATVTAPESLKEWKEANPLPFPIGHVAEKSDQTKWATGVQSLPWLILTDASRRVTAEGFDLDELDAKLASSNK